MLLRWFGKVRSNLCIQIYIVLIVDSNSRSKFVFVNVISAAASLIFFQSCTNLFGSRSKLSSVIWLYKSMHLAGSPRCRRLSGAGTACQFYKNTVFRCVRIYRVHCISKMLSTVGINLKGLLH